MICSSEIRVPVEPLVVSMAAASPATSSRSSSWRTVCTRFSTTSWPMVSRIPVRCSFAKPGMVTVTS